MAWDKVERRAHNCIQEETIGKFKEFMENTKGLKATLFVIVLTILLQVGSFLYLWGAQTEKIKNIEKIVLKLNDIKIVYAIGEQSGK